MQDLKDDSVEEKMTKKCKVAEYLFSTKDFKSTVPLPARVVLKNCEDPVLIFDQVRHSLHLVARGSICLHFNAISPSSWIVTYTGNRLNTDIIDHITDVHYRAGIHFNPEVIVNCLQDDMKAVDKNFWVEMFC